MHFRDLDDTTRRHMLDEATMDRLQASEFFGRRLTLTGRTEWPTLIGRAIKEHDATWLAEELREAGRLKTHEERRTKKGIIEAKVPVNAPEVLAQGEFNRYYIRGLCARAIEEGITHVIVYRARQSSNPRPESEAKIGIKLDAKALLEDLRAHPGEETHMGVPLVNSGLSVTLRLA